MNLSNSHQVSGDTHRDPPPSLCVSTTLASNTSPRTTLFISLRLSKPIMILLSIGLAHSTVASTSNGTTIREMSTSPWLTTLKELSKGSLMSLLLPVVNMHLIHGRNQSTAVELHKHQPLPLCLHLLTQQELDASKPLRAPSIFTPKLTHASNPL